MQTKSVLFPAYDGMAVLGTGGPITVFWWASHYLRLRGSAGYATHIVSPDAGVVVSNEGVPIQTELLSDFDDVAIDTIFVPGSSNIERMLQSSRIVAWLKDSSARAHRTASECTGAFLLAEAGLLQNRRVVTHWASCDLLASSYPALNVEREAIFVRDDPFWTSAGFTSCIDMALALVEDDYGHELAMQVSRKLIVYLKRTGGQPQFSQPLQTQAMNTTAFDALHFWLVEHFAKEDLNIEALAKRVHMSPRNFARSYKQRTGRSPGKTIELFRLEAAQRLLDETDDGIESVARRCGFGDQQRMLATFKRNLGITPREYRQRRTRT
ncbi:GlxA family transcriptional regulator [Dyella sp. Tek66A03]|uniref:GlxA family transcriptional regulator n=1 Tax=Dyella sp. Tek66A03 TaxID=3458298 RepID=UPI00403EF1F4